MLTATLTLLEAAVAVSHVPPETAAVNVLFTPLTDSVCAAGAVPPICQAKLSAAGLTVKVGAEVETVRVTGTVLGLPVEPGAVIVTEPL